MPIISAPITKNIVFFIIFIILQIYLCNHTSIFFKIGSAGRDASPCGRDHPFCRLRKVLRGSWSKFANFDMIFTLKNQDRPFRSTATRDSEKQKSPNALASGLFCFWLPLYDEIRTYFELNPNAD